MNLPDLSIKRPVFITCIFLLVMILGIVSLGRLGVDLFPNVNFPIISITTTYAGAGPNEIETLVSKPIEDTVSTLSGIKKVSSSNKEGVSSIVVEFTLETDLKYAEQQIRDRVAGLKSKLPDDAKDPIIRSIDPADQPIVILTLSADLAPADLFDLADQDIRSLIEQVKNVGLVDIVGGRKREIQVLLDLKKLKDREISASQVASRIEISGKNIPAGDLKTKTKEALIRTLGQFESLKDIRSTIISFYGNESPVQVSDVADVEDGIVDETSRSYVNGVPALSLTVYRRSGANTIAVVDAVKKRVDRIDRDFKGRIPGFKLSVVRDGGKSIQANVDDVTESIILGILLTVIVVYFFLGNVRSTIITGLALPSSLLGAFILMSFAGFSINVMTLLALSLSIGLLVDDAIVVRENIFRHMELGEKPRFAASHGTHEVTMAVVATTLTILAVFGPVAFLQGLVGQFFKEFGLTICFVILISLLDALMMAPMLSAHFAGNLHAVRKGPISKFFGFLVDGFGRFQDALETFYVRSLKITTKHPLWVIGIALLIFVGSFFALETVPKTFLPPQDAGEFSVDMDMLAGTPLEVMDKTAREIDEKVRSNPEVQLTVLTVGGQQGETNEASLFIQLVKSKKRKMNTTAIKDVIRQELVPFNKVDAKVIDVGHVAGGSQQPFNVNLVGSDLVQLEATADALYEKLKHHPDLQDVDLSTKLGKPEFRVVLDKSKGEVLGVSSTLLGQELRTLIEGVVPAVYREGGKEYDIRVRLKEDERNLKDNFDKIFIPNVNQRLIYLADVSSTQEVAGPSAINRQDRGRYIQLSAALNPKGKGMSHAMQDVKQILEGGDIKIPPGVRYQFVGEAEDFQELAQNMALAAILSVVFIYFVLASLYESFVTPLAIMLVLPLAACGAFYALAITRSSFDIFSMIGCIMLLGISTKNSILLVDYTNKLIREGKDIPEALLIAGKTRLRPIIMTTIALIAGMLPIAIGLNEASKQRTSMGISVIGGLISSTVLTLLVVPAAYSYIERFRQWTNRMAGKLMTHDSEKET